MSNGAKVDIENNEGKTPGQVAADENVRNILGSTETPVTVTETNFIPNYLQNPAFCHKVDLDIVENGASDQNNQPITTLDKDVINEVLKKSSFHQERQEPKSKLLILKIRIANQTDQDFIEIDVEDNQLNFQSLKVTYVVILIYLYKKSYLFPRKMCSMISVVELRGRGLRVN